MDVSSNQGMIMSTHLNEVEVTFLIPSQPPSTLSRDHGWAHSYDADLDRFDLPYTEISLTGIPE